MFLMILIMAAINAGQQWAKRLAHCKGFATLLNLLLTVLSQHLQAVTNIS